MFSPNSLLLACTLIAQVFEPRVYRPIRLQVVGDLPFSAEELASLVSARLRLGDDADALQVVVGPAEPAGIALWVGDRRASVNVGERTSVPAARVIALAIADLAGEGAMPLIESQIDGADGPDERGPSSSSTLPPDRLSAVAAVSRGFAVPEAVTYGLLVDLTRHRNGLAYGVALGGLGVRAQNAGLADEATLIAGVARLWVGLAGERFDLLAGPFAAPYHLGGAFDRYGVLAGAGAALRASFLLGGRQRLVGELRVDGFANRFQTSVGSTRPSFATPRVAVGIGVGITFDLGGS